MSGLERSLAGSCAAHSAPLHIAPDHPALPGHFPGMPIVPGVVLLDHALAVIGARTGLDLSACRVNSAKFLSPVRPGEVVRVNWNTNAAGAIGFDIVCGERRIATGSVRPGRES